MSMTLNLVELLLASGRQLVFLGRFHEALVPLTKLWNFRKLPKPVLEEINSLLGEIHFARQNFVQARRHLTALTTLQPRKAEYHHRLALAIFEDSEADRARAEFHFRRAVELESQNAWYWLDFGDYWFSCGDNKEGLAAIRKAYQLGIEDAEIVGEAAEILRRETQMDEATAKVRAAFFHNHGSADFSKLWQHHQFARIHAEQRMQEETRHAGDARAVILPFVPRAGHGKYADMGPKTIRMDSAEAAKGPRSKQPAPTRRPPQKG